MAERTERSVLNHLIERCRDAERGFRVAAQEARTTEVKEVLLRLAQQRHDFAEALLPHAYRLGGASVLDGGRRAALHRAWMHVKARVARNPDRAVVHEAAWGERFASAEYDEAVRDVLPPDAREVVEAQRFGVRIARCLLTQIASR